MSGPANENPSGNGLWAGVSLLMAVTLTLYLPVIGYEFLNYDDDSYVTANFLLPIDSWAKLARIFSGYYFALYVPLALVSYGIDHALAGLSPWVYHLHNLAYWAGTVVLAYVLMRRLVDGRVALAIALLFAVHPMHVESVAWISERKGLMSLFFTLASFERLLAYFDTGRSRWLVLSVLLWTAALLSKASALPTGLIFFAFLIWIRRIPVRRLLGPALPFIVLTLVFAVVSMKSSDDVRETTLKTQMYGGGLLATLRIMIPIWAGYWWQFLFPLRLELRYLTADFGSFASPRILLPLAFLAALAVSVILSLRRGGRTWPFLVGSFYVWLSPVMGLLPINFFRADRYLHGPMLMLCAGLVLGIAETCRKAGRMTLFWPLVGVIVIPWMLLTHNYRLSWHDSVSLWTDQLSKNAHEITYYTNLADAHLTRGQLESAEGTIRKGLGRFPGHPQLLKGLAIIHDHRNDLSAALDLYRQAYAGDSNQYSSIRRIAEIEWQQGQVEQARKDMDEALRALDRRPEKEQPLRYGRPDRDMGELLVSKAAMLGAEGKEREAEAALQEAQKVWPGAWQVLNPLALAAWKRGEYPAGAELLEESLRLHPDQPAAEALRSVMETYRQTGRPPGL